VLAAIFSIVSTYLLSGVTWAIGMVIVFIIVFIGIFFDMLGIAATAADETPFHAMAAERVNGSKQSILIVRSADRFASFCNDVIGDISGIISGTASAIVVISFTISIGQREDSLFHYIVAVVFTSVVAAVTVGGKAFGKSMAIRYSTPILFQVGKLFYILEDRFKIVVMKENKNKRKNKRNQ
jgi:Mg2+/Co2+ transporter CorB